MNHLFVISTTLVNESTEKMYRHEYEFGKGLREEKIKVKAKRMIQDKSELRGFCEGECMRRGPGDEPLTLMRCHSYMKLVKGGSPFCGRAYSLRA